MIKIMVVDDSLFMRNRLTKLLTEHGYEVIVAEDGEQAVFTYCRDNPDLVLMDITMPRKDGLQALAEICAFNSGAKVIMLTAMNQELAAVRAIRIGAADFLAKPVPPDLLLKSLKNAMVH